MTLACPGRESYSFAKTRSSPAAASGSFHSTRRPYSSGGSRTPRGPEHNTNNKKHIVNRSLQTYLYHRRSMILNSITAIPHRTRESLVCGISHKSSRPYPPPLNYEGAGMLEREYYVGISITLSSLIHFSTCIGALRNAGGRRLSHDFTPLAATWHTT